MRNALLAALMGVQLAGCQNESAASAKAESAKDQSGVSRSILVIPEQFLGRYESDPKHCRIAMADRDDDDLKSQGGNVLVVDPGELYFVQSNWPVQKIEYRSYNAIDVVLLHDLDMDGKKIESKQVRISLDQDRTLRFDDRSAPYFRCPKVG